MGRKQLTLSGKAQVSMEFVFLVSLAFMIMTVFIASTRSEFDELRSEEERTLVRDVGMMAHSELVIASNVEDGYRRIFDIPEKLDESIEYDIEISNNTLLVYTDDYESVFNVPSVTGQIQKGNNRINKTGGTIYLN
ncbi:hypothetical protein GF336_04195 [Candidatus Woesearchaeota archaeon]|nr:hypothetical protein [Candidatus Woesearchaeota archaeon]